MSIVEESAEQTRRLGAFLGRPQDPLPPAAHEVPPLSRRRAALVAVGFLLGAVAGLGQAVNAVVTGRPLTFVVLGLLQALVCAAGAAQLRRRRSVVPRRRGRG